MPPTAAAAAEAARVLANGGLVIFPTETVYGIGSRPEQAERLRQAKGRPDGKPFQLLAASLDMARAAGARFAPAALRLGRAFWPGPMTLVVPERHGGTVGVRIPDAAFVAAVLRALGGPVAASSANRAGRPAPAAAPAAAEFGEAVELIIDAGPIAGGAASVVIDATGPQPRILRPGVITEQQILEVWNAKETDVSDDRRIAVASDHAATEVKDRLIAHLRANGWDVTDFTQITDGRADYPVPAHKVGKAVAAGLFARGLLLCGSGLGISIAANKVPGVRAALCPLVEFARLSREHNDANILVLPGRVPIPDRHEDILDVWLQTPFSNEPRHKQRIAMIEDLTV